MRKVFLATACSVFLLNGAAFATDEMGAEGDPGMEDETMTFEDLDANNDGHISQDEAEAHPELADQYDEYTSEEGTMGEEEFAQFEDAQEQVSERVGGEDEEEAGLESEEHEETGGY